MTAIDEHHKEHLAVRAVFGAAVVHGAPPPYDRVQVRLYYPAAPPTGSAMDTGIVAVDPARNGLPVVILADGQNCGPEGYVWLAHHLAAHGYLAVTYLYTAPLPDDSIGLVADNGSAGPTSDGAVTRAVLDAVRDATQRAPLIDVVRLDTVALVGHSAGGRTSLYLSQDPRLGLDAVIVYAAHAVMPGHDGHPATPPLDPACPVLIAYGGADGVISESRGRYGADPNATWDPAAATFDALTDRAGTHLLVRLNTATHFSIAHHHDTATGRPFLEDQDPHPEQHRQVLADLFTAFLDQHLRGSDPASLAAVLHTDILTSRRR